MKKDELMKIIKKITREEVSGFGPSLFQMTRKNKNIYYIIIMSGGELLELRLLDTHLLDTFGSKSIARHKFYHLIESS